MFMKNNSGNCVIGRIAKEPEQKTFQSGKTKTRFVVKYGEDPTNRDENDRPKPLFLTVEAWGAVGRDAMLLDKGDYCIATGRLDSHEWEGKTYTSLVADAVWCDMSAFIRIVVGSLSDRPGNNSDNNQNPVPADPFTALSDDDGELPF